ncbi:unnamed protein product [Amoebophrya sp. A120]|nr:unnamed protein product [Amoebophrya sp. A120]|eukprot:GSA120T00017723001.1
MTRAHRSSPSSTSRGEQFFALSSPAPSHDQEHVALPQERFVSMAPPAHHGHGARHLQHPWTSFFIKCPQGYMCASQIGVIAPGHVEGQKESGVINEENPFTFEEGCPANGYLNARNICVPTNDPAPIKSRDEFRPCQTWSTKGFDEPACTHGGVTGCVCVLKNSAVESPGAQNRAGTREFLLPAVAGEQQAIAKNVNYKLETGGGADKEVPFARESGLKGQKTAVDIPEMNSGDEEEQGGESADSSETKAANPTLHVRRHYPGDLRTGLPGITDNTWQHNMVSYIQGSRYLRPISHRQWLGEDPRLAKPGKRLTRVSRAIRAARNVMRDLVDQARGLGLNLRAQDSAAAQAKEGDKGNKFCANLKKDENAMWEIANGLRFVQRANQACLRLQEDSLQMMTTSKKEDELSNGTPPGVAGETTTTADAAAAPNAAKKAADTAGAVPYLTKANMHEKLPRCLRNEPYELPWRHVFARIASEAAECLQTSPTVPGKHAMATGIFTNLFVE